MTISTDEPRSIRAGLRWLWERSDLSDYPAPTWTLTYWFKQLAAAGANFSIVATASGTKFSIDVPAATTGAYTAGEYSWAAIVSNGTDRREVEAGYLTVEPKYDAAAALDDRSHNRKMLDAIIAVLEARATSVQREMVGYQIGSRGQQFDQSESKASLLELKGRYEWLVKNEEDRAAIAAGAPNPRLIRVRFGSP